MLLSHDHDHWKIWLQKWFFPLLVAAVAVNAGALFITILEPDGALYATIAKTMAQTGDFINLKAQGNDWLDKPHFHFWATALSFKIFGINTFAYKLPALIFWIIGAWYTYRFAKLVYGKSVGQLAVLIYVTAAHLVISNNDVRAEPYLTGLVIASVFHFYRASQKKFSTDLIAGALFAALAIMTKGPFVLITICSGFVIEWCLKKEGRQFLNIRWIIALLLIILFITPELYCLYVQFDSHPEKIVFGKTGVSGIRFFFWDSQFGRFFNTGPIKGSGDPFFYLHTLLWAFLPWSLLLYAALYTVFRSPSRYKEYITTGAALVTFLIFSLSRFQLPHYLNMLFPFFAIITANYLCTLYNERTKKIIWWVQHIIAVILLLLIVTITVLFHFNNIVWIILVLLCLSAFILFLFRRDMLTAAFGRCFGVAVMVYMFINFLLYPALLKYQSGSEAAAVIKNDLKWKGPVYMLNDQPCSYSFEFYTAQTVQFCSLKELSGKKDVLLFVPEKISDSLVRNDHAYHTVTKLPHFHISQLTGKFINYKTRKSALDYYAIVLKR